MNRKVPLSTGDVRASVRRRSTRIGAKGPRLKQSETNQKTQSLRRRASLGTGGQSQNKPKGNHKSLVTGAMALNSSSLNALNMETINEPLPEALEQVEG
jgi:hypothetical protein